MKTNRLTRPAVAAALASLALGLVAHVAPPASAEGEVTVTWPEITEFDADTTDYVIDVDWDGSGGLFLWYGDPNGGLQSLDELHRSGAQTVDFPTADPGGTRQFQLYACAHEAFVDLSLCSLAGTSPPLQVARSHPSAPPPGDVSITWPEWTAFNPAVTPLTIDAQWDGTGSVFVTTLPRYGWVSTDEVPAPGQHTVQLLGDPRGLVDIKIIRCPGEVLEYEDAADCEIADWKVVEAWSHLEVTLRASRLGPSTAVPIVIGPTPNDPVDVHWEIRELGGGAILASGDHADLPPLGPLPPVGPQPALVDGQQYELRVNGAGSARGVDGLMGSGSRTVVWDSLNDAQIRVGGWVEPDHHFEPRDVVYPVVDGYHDHLWFDVVSGRDDIEKMQVEISAPGGAVVFDGAVTRPPFSSDGISALRWSASDESGAPLPDGEYQAAVSTIDLAGNVSRSTRAIHVSSKSIQQRIWKTSVTVDGSRIDVARGACGRLKRPARTGWLGSVGYYTRDDCAVSEASVETRNRVELPESFTGTYGRSRVTVVGGKARGESDSGLRLTYFGATYARWSTVVDGAVGSHPGDWRPALAHEVSGADGRFLSWGAKVVRGDRYDVRRFIVEVEYDVLE